MKDFFPSRTPHLRGFIRLSLTYSSQLCSPFSRDEVQIKYATLVTTFGPLLHLLSSLYSVCLRKCQVREIPEVGGHGGEAMNNNKKKLGGICILYAGYFYCTDDRNRQIKLGQPVRHVG